MTLEACIDEILMSGCGDWVNVSEVISVAKFTGGAQSEEEIRETSLTLIRDVVLQGLMEIGDLPRKQRRLELWPMTPQECLDRVDREWHDLGRNPSLGEICWLQNTDKGQARGSRMLKLWHEPRECADAMLMRSVMCGWVDLDWVIWLVESVGGAAPQAARNAAMATIRGVVEQRLMVLGDVSSQRFQKWEMPVQSSLERLEREHKNVYTGTCWLQNTDKGEALGKELFKRRDAASGGQ